MSKNCDYSTQCCSGQSLPGGSKKLFFNIKKTGLPEYLFNKIPQSNHLYNTQSIEDVKNFYSRTGCIQIFLFPYSILEWKKLDMQIRRSESFWLFKNSLLKIGWQTAKPTYNSPLEHS